MKKLVLSANFLLLALSLASCKKEEEEININIWHYYNNDQLTAFNSIVDEFNQTFGNENGITVTSESKGYVYDLVQALTDSSNNIPGSEKMPSMFMSYSDTVYMLNNKGLVADLDNYFTEEELAEYNEKFIDDGRIGVDKKLKIFPVAKSTEILMVNKTFFDKFLKANPTYSYDMLSTIEGVIEISEAYYNWSGGDSFYGRDSMSNYFITGAKQLGIDLFNYDENGNFYFDSNKEVIKKLFDSYYVPYIKGYFSSNAKFRSSDATTGNIICYTGSTSSAGYFPTRIVISDSETENVDCYITKPPKFAGSENISTIQGAGMVVTKDDKKIEEACVKFIKWFTKKDVNLNFSMQSSYYPVKNNSIDENYLSSVEDKIIKDTLRVTKNIFENDILFTNVASLNGNNIRTLLDSYLEDQATNDRSIVKTRITEGQTLQEATADFLEDDYFDNWYDNFLIEVRKLY